MLSTTATMIRNLNAIMISVKTTTTISATAADLAFAATSAPNFMTHTGVQSRIRRGKRTKFLDLVFRLICAADASGPPNSKQNP